ncbi:BglG family transcription antiterminator [Tessaracoccus sp. G1721]
MNRPAAILAQLEAARTVNADDLAAELEVSRRTISTDVAGLQDLLGTAASITVDDGRYRLLIADPARYRAVKASVADDVSFNDPAARASYIVSRVFRSLVPVRIEELATRMSVGRTTVVGDLARVRAMVAESDLAITGRPNVGLQLEGPELQQRLHVLRWHFPMAYPHEPWQERVEQIVRAMAADAGLDRAHAPELARWATVAVDRARMGRDIDYLPQRYSGLAATPAHAFAASVAERLGAELGVEFTGDEVTFLTLPVAGMRAPEDAVAAARFTATGDGETLVREVLAAVNSEMDIDLAGRRFMSEFARHVAYMINRMRYRIWVDDSAVGDIRDEYPVAYQMATVASQVIASQVGLPVDDAEVALLAAYFQVFLDGGEAEPPAFLRVAIVTTTGRVTAELLRQQLSRLLPASTRYEVVNLADATREALEGVDLVVVNGDDEVAAAVPVLRVTRILDRTGLERQLGRLQLHIPLDPGAHRSGSVLAGALDEAHFFALPAGTAYEDAVDYMTGHLEARGLVEQGFGDRIREREAQSQTRLDPWLGFPHAPVETRTSVMLSIGVVAPDGSDDGVRLIVLLGVPSDPGRSEGVLVQVYDEVLRLGSRRDLIDQLSRVTTFEQFYYFLERHPLTERER